MKKDTYIRFMQSIKRHPYGAKIICRCNSLFTKFVYISYPIFLLWLVKNREEIVIRVLCTTAISFLIVSAFRKVFNRQRPYERFGEPPVISKDKKGNSFPSRHVFSAFVIAMSFLYVNWSLGIVFLLVASAIAVLRVAGGVHYPSDVIAGAVIGIGSGILGFWIL